MGRSEAGEILDLVGSIYDVALSAEGWEPLLERMTRHFQGTAAVFFVRDHRAVDTVFFRRWGLPDAMLAEAVERLSSVDVGMDGLLALAPGTVVTDDSDASRVDPRSDVVADFLTRWDVGRYIGCDVFRDERRFGVVTVLGSHRREPFGHAEIDLMETLVPHLRRAVELRSQSHQQDADRSVVQQLIEGMLTGVVLLDRHGRVLTANATARRIGRACDGLVLSRERLRAASPADDELLQKAVAEAIAISAQRESEGGVALTVRRPSGARPYALVVSPGASAVAETAMRIASAVVLIGDPDSSLASADAIAMELYGLTPSEARLACAVASGDSLEGYARTRGITVATARWTMKQTLSTMGARRQADLVRMLLAGPVAIALRDRPEA